MRIGSAQFFVASSASVQSTQSNLFTLQQQIVNGIILTNAGNNPSAFGQMARLRQTQDANDQYQSNRSITDARLTSVSSALTNPATTLQQDKQTLVGANTSLMTESRRVGVLAQVKQRYQQLLSTANQRDAAGVALFDGTNGTTDPFTSTGGSVQYVDSDQSPVMQVSQNISMPDSVSGDSVFVCIPSLDVSNPNANQNVFKTYKKPITALLIPTNAAMQVVDVTNLQEAVQTAQGNLDDVYQVAL